SIYSPYSGYVLFNLNDNASATAMSSSTASSGMGGMGGAAKSSPQNYSSTNSEQIREGLYVSKGQTLFAVNDFKEVWAVISVDSKQQSKIKINGDVKIKSEVAEENVMAKINFIEPYFENGTKYSRVRVYLSNQKNLFKLNSFITAQFNFSLNALMIPSAAILDLGNKKVVWLKTGTTQNGKNIYKVRIVETGAASKDFTEIKNGLSANEEVASDAGYLLDSEGLVNPEKHQQ
ncbi:MAG: efflux RND transporter periplasmic adaptor subunit, partial [Bacteroidia bacterium]